MRYARQASLVLVLTGLLVLCGCGGKKPALEKTVYLRDVFQRKFIGRTTEDVRAILGDPDDAAATRGGEISERTWDDVWTYHRCTRESAGSKVDRAAILTIKYNRIRGISFAN